MISKNITSPLLALVVILSMLAQATANWECWYCWVQGECCPNFCASNCRKRSLLSEDTSTARTDGVLGAAGLISRTNFFPVASLDNDISA